MSRKMHINRLSKEELTYELNIRGIGTGTCDEMRHRLGLALQMERNGDSLKYPKYPYSFEEDHKAVRKNLDEVEQLIAQFQDGRSSTEALKIQTKLSHTLGRLDNMETDIEDNLRTKSESLAKALTLMEAFNGKVEDFEKKRTVPISLGLLETRVEASTFHEGIHNASRSSAIEEQNRRTDDASGSSSPIVPPHKWNLAKFSGDQRGMSISAWKSYALPTRGRATFGQECI